LASGYAHATCFTVALGAALASDRKPPTVVVTEATSPALVNPASK